MALISPSMLGLGLPDYLWNQVVNLLYQANNINLNSLGMECYQNNNADGAANCQIASTSCTDSSLNNLWDYGFKFTLAGTT